MKKIDEILSRLDALSAAHPDMIWHDVHTVHVWDGNEPLVRYSLRVVCPVHYCIWPTTNNLTLCEKYTLEDGEYTLIGLARKVTALERMDWSKLDTLANAARVERVKLSAELDAFYAVANAPVED